MTAALISGCRSGVKEPLETPPATSIGYIHRIEVVPAGEPDLTVIRADSLQVVPATGNVIQAGPPQIVPTNTNIHPAGKPRLIGRPDSTPVFTPGKNGLLLPKTITTQGSIRPAGYPIPVIALNPDFRDNAIVNIQCLEVDQGMSTSSVLSIFEDSLGNMWFGTINGGVSRYNGNSFTHFTTNEGLGSNEIFSILEDRHGNIWFGAAVGGGIVKYDGVNFIRFAGEEGIGTRVIYNILEDKKGQLWFGTEEDGVFMFDGQSFRQFSTKQGLCGNTVYSILEDRQGDIWFGVEGGGFCKYDGQRFIHFSGIEGLSNNIVASMTEDRNGHLWFGTNSHGIFRYDGREFIQYTTEHGLSNNTVLAIQEDQLGHLWFGTRGGGVSRLDPNTGPHGVFTYYTEEEGLSNNTVLSMGQDHQGNLWIGTEGGGVCKYVLGSFEHYSRKQGLKSNPVRTILKDSKGNLWIGTQRGDISKYDGQSFTHFTLTNRWIISIIEDRDGNLWFGTFGDGVIRYKPDARPPEAMFTQFTENEGLSNNDVELIMEDSQGNLWIGTFEGGVNKYDGKNFTHFTQREGLGSNSVISLLEDGRGNIWFCTFGGGISRFDGNTMATYTTEEGLSDNSVRSIIEDGQGNLWLGTAGKGISKFDGKNFTHFSLKEGLGENYIRSLFEEPDGNFWAGTANGLFHLLFNDRGLPDTLRPEKAGDDRVRIIEYGKLDGLKSVDFLSNSVCLDRNNHLWWGTEKGLTTLDLNDVKFATQPPRVQINGIFLNQNFVDFHMPDVEKKYGLKMNGLINYYNLPKNLELPFNVNSLSFQYAGIDWIAPKKITYQYMLKGFDESWSLPTREIKAEYRNLPHGRFIFLVRAIGEAGIWSEPLEYPFYILPPLWQTWWAFAIYTLLFLVLAFVIRHFQLKRRRRQQLEEIERARLEEKSKQAEKIKAQAEKLESSFQELQQKNEEIIQARDQLILQEKLASLGHLTAGIAHEIKNPLNFINNYAEGSAELAEEFLEEIKKLGSKLPADTYAYFTEMLQDLKQNAIDIENNGRKVDRIVRSMMDHARGTDIGWQYVDLNEILDENANLAYHSYRAIEPTFAVDLKKEYAPDLPIIKTLPQHIGRVFLNILNNACYAINLKQKKFRKEYQPEIVLTTSDSKDFIEIRIRDNGPGIPARIRKEIFTPFFTTKPTGVGNTGLGLSICYDIVVKEHQGKLEVESKDGEFTEFTISLPKNIELET